ncbi:MFS transporter [Corynebacterium sp. zg-331]|uniref:MFS transporter n=1 Tax=unclassified Corynebacterium TaxID=2624378 RepID=UPI00140049A7|nr:MFS transporter [Corynebacterium sp. zg-331]MPV52902.1 MFS transporter [Corynebacterium sp. zg331]
MKVRWLTTVVALSAAIMTLDMTVVTIALPDITREFSAGLDDAQWIVNAYVLVFAALLLGVGALSDHMPRHRLFILGHLIFGASSLFCALSSSSGMLIAGRVCQAIGATLVFGTCMPLIADAHEGNDAARSRAVGAFMAAGALAAALGPLIGGLLVGGGGWRWIFTMNIPVSIIAMVVMALVAPNNTRVTRKTTGRDWASTVLVALGLFCANYALVTGPNDGWNSTNVLATIIAAVFFLAVFVVIQLRAGEDALLDLRLFSVPSFSAAIILSFTGRLVTFGLLTYLIFWLSGIQALSPIGMDLVLLALAMPMVIIAAPSSALEKTGKVNIVTSVAMIITAIGLLWAALALGPDSTWCSAIGPLLITGIGAGLAMPHMMNITISVVPASRSGAATGATNSAFPLGTATGVAIFGAILTSHIDSLAWASAPVREAASAGRVDLLRSVLSEPQVHEVTEAFMAGLDTILITGAAVSVVCGLICFVSIRQEDRHVAADAGMDTRTSDGSASHS